MLVEDLEREAADLESRARNFYGGPALHYDAAKAEKKALADRAARLRAAAVRLREEMARAETAIRSGDIESANAGSRRMILLKRVNGEQP